MDSTALLAFFMMQMWSIPQLVVLAIGAVIVLRYGRQERFVTFAVTGCALMIASLLLSAGQSYWTFALREEGVPPAEIATRVYTLKVLLLNRLMDVGGLGLIIAAAVTGRPKKA